MGVNIFLSHGFDGLRSTLHFRSFSGRQEGLISPAYELTLTSRKVLHILFLDNVIHDVRDVVLAALVAPAVDLLVDLVDESVQLPHSLQEGLISGIQFILALVSGQFLGYADSFLGEQRAVLIKRIPLLAEVDTVDEVRDATTNVLADTYASSHVTQFAISQLHILVVSGQTGDSLLEGILRALRTARQPLIREALDTGYALLEEGSDLVQPALALRLLLGGELQEGMRGLKIVNDRADSLGAILRGLCRLDSPDRLRSDIELLGDVVQKLFASEGANDSIHDRIGFPGRNRALAKQLIGEVSGCCLIPNLEDLASVLESKFARFALDDRAGLILVNAELFQRNFGTFSRFGQNLQSAPFLLGLRIQRSASLDHTHLVGTLDIANQRLT